MLKFSVTVQRKGICRTLRLAGILSTATVIEFLLNETLLFIPGLINISHSRIHNCIYQIFKVDIWAGNLVKREY